MDKTEVKEFMRNDYLESLSKNRKHKSTRDEYSYVSKYGNTVKTSKSKSDETNTNEEYEQELKKNKNKNDESSRNSRYILSNNKNRHHLNRKYISKAENSKKYISQINTNGKYIYDTIKIEGTDKVRNDFFKSNKKEYSINLNKNAKIKSKKKSSKKRTGNRLTNNVKNRILDVYINDLIGKDNRDLRRIIKAAIKAVSKVAKSIATLTIHIGLQIITKLLSIIVSFLGVPLVIAIIFIAVFNYLFDEGRNYNNNYIAKASIEQSLMEVGLSLDNEIYNYTEIISDISPLELRRNIALISLVKNNYDVFDEENMSEADKKIVSDVVEKLINVSLEYQTQKITIQDGDIIGQKSISEYIYNGHDYSSKGILFWKEFGLHGSDGSYDMFDNILLQYVCDIQGHSICDNCMLDATLGDQLFIPIVVDHRSSIPLGSIIEVHTNDGKIYYCEVICKAHEFNNAENDEYDLCFFSTTKLALGKSYFYQDEFGCIARINNITGPYNSDLADIHSSNGDVFMSSEDVVLYYRTATDLINKNPDFFKENAKRLYNYFTDNGYTAYSNVDEVQKELEYRFEMEYGDDGAIYSKSMVVDEGDPEFEDLVTNYNGIPENLYNRMNVTGKIINIQSLTIDQFIVNATNDDGTPYLTSDQIKLLQQLVMMYDEGHEGLKNYVDSIFCGKLQDTLVDNVTNCVNNNECNYKTMPELIANEYLKSGIFCNATLNNLCKQFEDSNNLVFNSKQYIIEKGDLIFVEDAQVSILFTRPDRTTSYVGNVMVYIGENKCVYQDDNGKFCITDVPDNNDIVFIGRFNY